MKRQSGFAVWLPFFLLTLLGYAAAEEMRAVWVVRHHLTSEASVREVVEVSRASGINTLFVQVRGRGDAYYDSDIAPTGEGVSPGFDPLQACIDEASAAGLRVHAWMNVYLSWYVDRDPPDSHILRSHPDWFMISRDGIDLGQLDLSVDLVYRGVEGRYLSPANPSVHRHLLALIDELVEQYPVDGVHLDYVRYPNEHYDYSPLAQAGFWAETGEEVPEATGSDRSRRIWNRWRSEQVTEFVRSARHRIDARGQRISLSAAVKPDLLSAYDRYGQDWAHWMNRRYLDFAMPMFYTGSTQEIRKKMIHVRKYVQKGRIYAGIGAWNQTTAETLDQIDAARKARLDGFCLFSFETLASSKELQTRLRTHLAEGDMP